MTAMTRILFVLLVLCSGLLYAVGRGWLGTAPADEGRQPLRAAEQLAPEAVQLGTPRAR